MSFNKNTIALMAVAIIILTFFIAGLFDVLEHIITKLLLFGSTALIVIISFVVLLKNLKHKKRLSKKI